MSCTLRSSARSALQHNALHLACLSLFSAFFLSVPLRAAAIDESIPDSDGLAQLEQRASQASPREQCFLYAQLVHTMTEKAGKEIAEGDIDKANATLKQINQFAHMIQVNLAKDTKRLKDAEMLMHHTTYRLAEYLHRVSGDDKTTVQATLKQLDQVNDELLTQVFSH
jgi:putative cell wall-binding protein